MTLQRLLAIICVELLIVQPYVYAQQQPPLNQQMPANPQRVRLNRHSLQVNWTVWWLPSPCTQTQF